MEEYMVIQKETAANGREKIAPEKKPYYKKHKDSGAELQRSNNQINHLDESVTHSMEAGNAG